MTVISSVSFFMSPNSKKKKNLEIKSLNCVLIVSSLCADKSMLKMYK